MCVRVSRVSRGKKTPGGAGTHTGTKLTFDSQTVCFVAVPKFKFKFKSISSSSSSSDPQPPPARAHHTDTVSTDGSAHPCRSTKKKVY